MEFTAALSLDPPPAAGDLDELPARVLDHLRQGVVVTDPARPDNPIVYASRMFLELTGYDEHEVVGRNCRFLQGEGTDPAAVAELGAAIAAGQPFAGELLNYRRDGTPFRNALSVRPLRDEAGAITHFVATQTDVTPLPEGRERAERRRRLEALGTFAGGVAHDFNNVLQAAAGFAGLLASSLEEVDPGLAELARDVVEACERGTALNRQLFAFARRGEAEPEPVDVDSAVSQLAARAAQLLPEGVSLDVRRASHGTVFADPGQLERALLELVLNARDALPEGGTIGVRTSATPDAVRVEVTDAGTGMPPEVAARVFEPFFGTKERDRGTGLGLAIVDAIVTRLGGTVSVETEVGRGSTFTVALPPLRSPHA